MCRKNFVHFVCKLIIPVLVFIIVGASDAWAFNSIKTQFLLAYPSAVGSRLATLPSAPNHCGACHFNFSGGGALNPYGTAVGSTDETAAEILALGSLDSDGDGFTNNTEIIGTGFTNIPTFPGLKPSNVSSVSNVTVSELTGFLVPVAVAQTGSLQVTLGPAAAVTAGAQWNVDGGAFQNSGATVGGLSVGSHTVNYKAVSGWIAPPSESVSITDGATTQLSRNYTLIPPQTTPGRVVLVYKTTLKVNPVATRDSESVDWEAGKFTRATKAWIVIDVNLADPNVDDIQAALIPYGKSPAGAKVYVNDAVLDIFLFSILEGLNSKPDIFLIDFTANNIAAERVGVGIVDARMQGTAKTTKISSSESQDVAKTLKGATIDDSLNDDTLAGSGTVSAVLDSALTKQANNSGTDGFDGVFADVVAGIKSLLESKGFSAVTQTP